LETDEQLIDRYKNVKELVEKNKRQLEKMQYGPARIRKAQWGGCLTFTLLQIESEMAIRNL